MQCLGPEILHKNVPASSSAPTLSIKQLKVKLLTGILDTALSLFAIEHGSRLKGFYLLFTGQGATDMYVTVLFGRFK